MFKWVLRTRGVYPNSVFKQVGFISRQARRWGWSFGKKYCAAPHTPAPRLSICSFPLNVCATPQPELSDTLTGRTRRACLRQARLWAASPPTRVSAQPKRAACAAKRKAFYPSSAFKQVGFISGNVKRRDCGDSAELFCVCKTLYPSQAFKQAGFISPQIQRRQYKVALSAAEEFSCNTNS